jgi:aspartyl-tRNA(Asn)/glutamyl-tRNA(Gln) amidotransferase subunit C
MAGLTRTEVEEIALLARLHLEPAEVDKLQTELGAILEHFTALANVDTTDVPPLTHTSQLVSPLRADAVEPSLDVALALKAAPKKVQNLIVVPAIIPGSDS